MCQTPASSFQIVSLLKGVRHSWVYNYLWLNKSNVLNYFLKFTAMNFTEKDIYHIYNRGNNSQQLFFEEENYTHFLKLVKKFLSPLDKSLILCILSCPFSNLTTETISL